MISLLDLGVQSPRDAMILRAPETEALLGHSPHLEPRDPSLDGSPVPLGSTATSEPIEIPRSLWGRWKSPMPQDQNLWIKRQSNTQQKNISDNQ
ncbi:MAG: hypothetical protein RQ855_04165 [Desulfurococcales archaeon]|nr:hypothetical protein [Desulfurococcales archaeon]